MTRHIFKVAWEKLHVGATWLTFDVFSLCRFSIINPPLTEDTVQFIKNGLQKHANEKWVEKLTSVCWLSSSER